MWPSLAVRSSKQFRSSRRQPKHAHRAFPFLTVGCVLSMQNDDAALRRLTHLLWVRRYEVRQAVEWATSRVRSSRRPKCLRWPFPGELLVLSQYQLVRGREASHQHRLVSLRLEPRKFEVLLGLKAVVLPMFHLSPQLLLALSPHLLHVFLL